MGIEIRHQTQGKHLKVGTDGNLLEIGGHPIDLADRQREQTVTVDLSLGRDGQIVEGHAAGWYVANVTIPPAHFQEVEGEPDPATGGPVLRLEQLPVNLDLVVVSLWALPEEAPASSQ